MNLDDRTQSRRAFELAAAAERVFAHIEKKLGIRTGESTPDGKFYLKKEEECLAACAGAPMMVIDGHYHERLTPAKLDELFDALD